MSHEQKDCMSKHDAEACVLSCIDFRLVDATVTELEQTPANPFDYTAIPGASLYVIRPEFPDWKTTYLQTLQVARDLHNINGMVIVQHENCGAFSGAYPYLIDPITGRIPVKIEKKLAIKYLKRARDLTQKLHEDLYFKGYWIGLDGKLELVVFSEALV